MKTILIKNGRVIDPGSNLDRIADILIVDGVVKEIKKNIAKKPSYEAIDARKKIVTPGFIDMHTHLREPGREDEETILTGTKAACKGGFTSVVCMANTDPPIDDVGIVRLIFRCAEEAGFAKVYPVGAVSKGLKGEELAEIGDLYRAGIVAVSDDGMPVTNSEIMRRALEYTNMFDIPVISHCEDRFLCERGVMNEGYTSTRLGLEGIPSVSEVIMVARNIILAEYTKGRIHIAHVSTAESVNLIRDAKKRKVKVTAETAPHYFTLTDELVESFDTNLRVNPPLRSKEDLSAIVEGLKDGTIDVIATDHAPHTKAEKEVEFDAAPTGMIGLETALGLILTQLIEKSHLTLPKAISKITLNPSSILKIKGGIIKLGEMADITIFDPEFEWECNPNEFESKSKNTPFKGWKMKGRVEYVIVSGRIVLKDGKIVV